MEIFVILVSTWPLLIIPVISFIIGYKTSETGTKRLIKILILNLLINIALVTVSFFTLSSIFLGLGGSGGYEFMFKNSNNYFLSLTRFLPLTLLIGLIIAYFGVFIRFLLKR